MFSKRQLDLLTSVFMFTAQLSCYNDLIKDNDKKYWIDAVFLHFCKAFDSVVHSKFIYKIQMFGFLDMLCNSVDLS